jgi:Ca-activated chloride channel family protein
LLIVAGVLLALLLIRVETARAQDMGLEFHDGARSAGAVALNTDMQAEVTGMIARVNVVQSFRNPGGEWAEAVYRYPLPDGAAVDRLLIQVGDRVLEGEIQEKQTARRQYQQARSSGHVATLVEQQRANQFETRLANIGPGEDIRVAISFLTRVEYRDGAFSLQIPMTFTPRWEADSQPGLVSSQAPRPLLASVSEQSDHYLTLSVELKTGLSLARLESSHHDVDIHPALGGYNIFLSDPDERTDRLFELSWAPDLGAAPASSLMTWDGGDEVYALLMLAPPIAGSVSPQPREVVFIIDTSGSMEGASLQQAAAALRQGLAYLGPDDRFNLIEFNSDSLMLFEQSLPVDGLNLEIATGFIDGLIANGGTNMEPALHQALTLPQQTGLLRQVVFITDGSVGNESELLLQVAKELGESRLFTVSIGSAPNSWFMRKAAEIGRGNHTHIGRLEDVEEKVSSLWSRIQYPALQDLCIDWGMQAEYFPEVLPDLYAGEPLWITARLPLEPGEITLCGNLNGRPWEQVSRPQAGGGSENLANLWARAKIEALEDSRLFGMNADWVRTQVLELALEFGLLTAYTSMVAVDRTPVRPEHEAMVRRHVASLLPAGSTGTATGFATTATGWPARLLLASFTLLIAAGLFWFCTPSRPAGARGARRPLAANT